MNIKLLKGDNRELLKTLEDNSIDSVITDPPYALTSIKKRYGNVDAKPPKDGVYKRTSKGFMGKTWDSEVPSVEFWEEIYRVLKPGGHVLSFGGTRTYHRMVVNIEDAGFEIRDTLTWLYGSGFPKLHNIGKAIDKLNGDEREVVGNRKAELFDNDVLIKQGSLMGSPGGRITGEIPITKGNSEYEGWGSALKPAVELIVMARKPLSEKTIAANVLKWGTGGINIDDCRIGNIGFKQENITNISNSNSEIFTYLHRKSDRVQTNEGRFPSNLYLDEDAAKLLDEQSGISKSLMKSNYKRIFTDNPNCYGVFKNPNNLNIQSYGDSGGASRFFYVAKVSSKERNLGLDNLEDKVSDLNSGGIGRKISVEKRLEHNGENAPTRKNTHPTIKPINLLIDLCRLITPKDGIILDPFMGSGSTGISALLEGFNFIGMELEEDYFKIAEARIEKWEEYKKIIKEKNI